MKIKYFWAIFAFILIAYLIKNFLKIPPQNNAVLSHCAADNSLSLIIEPDDGMAPVLAVIKNARQSVDLVMYELDDHEIEAALADDEKRGVAVRILLDGGYEGRIANENQEAYNFFLANDVPVRWTPKYFTLTHQKSLVVDGQAFIMSFNLTPHYYASDRDFAIDDHNQCDVAVIEAIFDDDWEERPSAKISASNLVVSPGSRPKIISVIAGATKTLDVYNEEMADPEVEAALAAAAGRGVDVKVLMTYSSEWQSAFKNLAAAGVKIQTYPATAQLYIHAKMIIADAQEANRSTAFIGSENFSPTSLDKNRELGILFSNSKIIMALSQVFDADWTNAKI